MVAFSMPESVRLPGANGEVHDYTPAGRFLYAEGGPPPRTRLPYAAVHVVANALADTNPVGPAAVDWDRTLAFRRHIWAYGLGVAEAMDTAQRGMGLDWDASKELIRRSVAEAKAASGIRAGRARRRGRVRGAVRIRRGSGRPGRPHGEPRAGEDRPRP